MNTYPESRQRVPAAALSFSCRSRCRLSTRTVSASRATTRQPAALFGGPTTT
ncbi:hypothetical protein [[Actinomadura] parvosata]|uniref:hypothetical protein n=1 Tax=[Actinomadura] parvosata TaxID=1955412 RepID=UPI0016464601